MTQKVLTKTKQPVKSIAHQDIAKLKDTLEKLQSWLDTIAILNDFFDQTDGNVNKKQIIRKYHAYSKIFSIFQTDFIKQTQSLEKQIDTLRNRPKVTHP